MEKRKAIQQMFVALSMCCIIVATGYTLVASGTQTEQANKVEQYSEPTQTTTTTTTAPKLWYFAEIPLDKNLQDYIIRTCHDYGVDPAVVMAMIKKESNYNPSNMGDGGRAYGLMQIHPRWHSGRMQRLGCTELLDPYHNVTVGIDYLAELYKKYDCDYAKALTAYNQGSYKGTVTQYAKAVLAVAERIGKYE